MSNVTKSQSRFLELKPLTSPKLPYSLYDTFHYLKKTQNPKQFNKIDFQVFSIEHPLKPLISLDFDFMHFLGTVSSFGPGHVVLPY